MAQPKSWVRTLTVKRKKEEEVCQCEVLLTFVTEAKKILRFFFLNKVGIVLMRTYSCRCSPLKRKAEWKNRVGDQGNQRLGQSETG